MATVNYLLFCTNRQNYSGLKATDVFSFSIYCAIFFLTIVDGIDIKKNSLREETRNRFRSLVF